MSTTVIPTAYLQERPTPSDARLNFRHVTFFGKEGDEPLYTLAQARVILGLDPQPDVKDKP